MMELWCNYFKNMRTLALICLSKRTLDTYIVLTALTLINITFDPSTLNPACKYYITITVSSASKLKNDAYFVCQMKLTLKEAFLCSFYTIFVLICFVLWRFNELFVLSWNFQMGDLQWLRRRVYVAILQWDLDPQVSFERYVYIFFFLKSSGL